jgi:hypothetical protein
MYLVKDLPFYALEYAKHKKSCRSKIVMRKNNICGGSWHWPITMAWYDSLADSQRENMERNDGHSSFRIGENRHNRTQRLHLARNKVHQIIKRRNILRVQAWNKLCEYTTEPNALLWQEREILSD